jgi:hypothetical protein
MLQKFEKNYYSGPSPVSLKELPQESISLANRYKISTMQPIDEENIENSGRPVVEKKNKPNWF